MTEHTSTDLRTTPLTQRHKDLGARTAPFAGWEMPIQYPGGILTEHRHTRARASLFDTCHMSEFRITGPRVAEALDAAFARGTADQETGTCRYSFLLSEAGTILDDLIVYRLGDGEFFVVANAGTRESDREAIRDRVPNGIEFADVSDTIGKLDLQGPESCAVLQELGVGAEALPARFRCSRVTLAGLDVLISGTGYTGELGYEMYVPAEATGTLWDRLLACEAVEPAGLGARDTLRLEAGLPLYGHDLHDAITPVEAGFAWVLRPADRTFEGRVALQTAPTRRLTGFELDGRRAAREGSTIFAADGRSVGTVTSGSFGPTVGKAISLGYVEGDEPPPAGARYWLGRSWERALPAAVIKLPFYRRERTGA